MTFAAKLYLASRRELSAQLVGVAVSGTPPRIDETVYII
jgi:hypothetical protein